MCIWSGQISKQLLAQHPHIIIDLLDEYFAVPYDGTVETMALWKMKRHFDREDWGKCLSVLEALTKYYSQTKENQFPASVR